MEMTAKENVLCIVAGSAFGLSITLWMIIIVRVIETIGA